MAHKLTLDYEGADALDTPAYQSYCSCGWSGDWHHVDDGMTDDDAETAAIEDGSEHLACLS